MKLHNPKKLQIAYLIAVVFLLMSCDVTTKPSLPELRTVPKVNLERYAGRWYEIARFPHSFQKGCYGSRATYRLRENGTVAVLNECREDGPTGSWRKAEGTARVIDTQSNAKLKVTFFWPFYGDYWIIDLGRDYEFAVVGHPSRKYLWILSRTPSMESTLYEAILKRLDNQHYDTSKLMTTIH